MAATQASSAGSTQSGTARRTSPTPPPQTEPGVRTYVLDTSVLLADPGALRRFAEYHALEGAFGRRALTERAKGVLMERHAIDEERAFTMLRDEARRTQRKLVDVAAAVLASHRLLPRGRDADP